MLSRDDPFEGLVLIESNVSSGGGCKTQQPAEVGIMRSVSVESVAVSVGLKFGPTAARRFGRWYVGGELGALVKSLEREYGHAAGGIRTQPDVLGYLWTYETTGQVDIHGLAVALEPLCRRDHPNDAAEVAHLLAQAIRDRYLDVKKGDDLQRFIARRDEAASEALASQMLDALREADSIEAVAERGRQEARLHSLLRLRDIPPVGEALRDAETLYGLGVSRSSVADDIVLEGRSAPYVARTIDTELAQAVETSRFVVISGPSKAGKSRTGLEAALLACPEASLVVPRFRQGVAELLGPALLGLRFVPEDAILVWLDDIDRYIAEDSAFDDLAVTDLLEVWPHLTLLGTMQSGAPGSGVLSSVLARAVTFVLPEALDAEEAAQAHAIYADIAPQSGERLGEKLVAADYLVARLEGASNVGETMDPDAPAIIEAAADLRRVGLSRAVSSENLFALWTGADGYARRRRPATRTTEDRFAPALESACHPVASSVAPLSSTITDAGEVFDVFDYLVAYFDGRTHHAVPWTRVPPATVALATTLMSPSESWAVTARLVAWLDDENASPRLRQSYLQAVRSARVPLDVQLLRLGDTVSHGPEWLTALVDEAEVGLKDEAPKTTIALRVLRELRRCGEGGLCDRLSAVFVEQALQCWEPEPQAALAVFLLRDGTEVARPLLEVVIRDCDRIHPSVAAQLLLGLLRGGLPEDLARFAPTLTTRLAEPGGTVNELTTVMRQLDRAGQHSLALRLRERATAMIFARSPGSATFNDSGRFGASLAQDGMDAVADEVFAHLAARFFAATFGKPSHLSLIGWLATAQRLELAEDLVTEAGRRRWPSSSRATRRFLKFATARLRLAGSDELAAQLTRAVDG